MYVKGVERSSKYTVRAVMLCMLKVLKQIETESKYTLRAHDIFAFNFLNIQLIFNPKKFWKAET